jgi:hypothetical protein
MRLSRRASWLLIAFAIWSWIIWVVLIKNINADPRAWNGNSPTGFLMVHVVLAIISITMGTAIGWLGWKGLKAHRAAAAAVSAQAGAGSAGEVAAEAREPERSTAR